MNIHWFGLWIWFCYTVQIAFEGSSSSDVVEYYKFIKKHAGIPLEPISALEQVSPDHGATETEIEETPPLPWNLFADTVLLVYSIRPAVYYLRLHPALMFLAPFKEARALFSLFHRQ